MTYSWKGLKKVSLEKALDYFICRRSVYLINADDTKELAKSTDDIIKHFGEYGIEL